MISAWSASENKRNPVFVEGTGGAVTYSITDLTPLSDYIVEMSSDDYPYQAFKNKLRPDEADRVDLSKGNAGGIDFAIPSQLATISGTITFPGDVAAGDTAQITVYSPSRNISLSTQVQTSGSQIVSYTITGLLPASDYIVYISSSKYVDHYYYSASAVTSEDGQYLINGLKSRDSQNAVLNDYTVTVLAPGYPPQSVGAKKVGETVDFYLSKGVENTISGTIADSDGTVPSGIDFAVEAFEESGRFVSSASADKTGKFDISTLVPEKQYYLKFTAYADKNPTVSQWADSSNAGPDNPVTDDPPSGAKLYHTNTAVNFKFSKPVKTSSVPPAHSKPAPVQNVKSFTHIIGKVKNTALRGSAGPDYIPPSNNPNPSLTYTLPPGAKCYVSYNTDPDYTIDKRNAPESPPAGSSQSTGNNMSGDGKVVYAHIAVVDERGRIGETITVPIRIDNVAPTNGVAKASASSSGDTVSLKLGASGPGVKDMNISNTGYGKNADWETRVKDKDWKLSDGDGKKDVYVQYRDDAKNVANYKISVDKTTPQPPPKPGALESGVSIENQKFVVDINAPDGTVIGTVIANSSLLIKNGTKSYEMPVQVSDGKNIKVATITVQVVDKSKDKLIVADQTFSTDKSFESGTYVGTVTAVAADTAAVLSYHIISGNDDEIFAINTKTGDIVIADAAKLSATQYVLVVEVSDGKNKATGKITIDVTGDQVFVSDKNFSVEENAAIGTVVGTVSASSGNPEAVLSYGIVSGNTDSVFAIDSAAGAISLIGTLNYDKASSYTLGIEVSDGKNKSSATVKIAVNPVNKETLKGTWTWENPAISGASSAWFKNIAGFSQSSEIFVVGGRFDYDASMYKNLIYLCSDGQWAEMQSNSSEWLYDVWGRSPSDIYAAGDGGTILHYDGAAWTAQRSGGTEKFRSLTGFGKYVFVSGENGVVFYSSGRGWSQLPTGTNRNFMGIWTDDSSASVVGDNGAILRFSITE